MFLILVVSAVLLCVAMSTAFVAALVLNDRDARRADQDIEVAPIKSLANYGP